MSDAEFPGPYRPDPRRSGRRGDARDGGDGRFPARDSSSRDRPQQRDAWGGRGSAPAGGRHGNGRGTHARHSNRGWDGSYGQDSPPQTRGNGGAPPGRAQSRRAASPGPFSDWEQRRRGSVTAPPGRGSPWDEGGDAGPRGRGDARQGMRGAIGYGRSGPPRRGGPGGGDGRGGGPPRTGEWWRHWTLKKALTVLACAAGVMVVLGAVGVEVAYAKTPIPVPQSAALQQASTVYFSDGKTLVGQFGTTDRQLLAYSQIPPMVRAAVVAAEDKNFWHEGGISPTGILRAAFYDLTSSGGNLQGGSTITQQLVRNYYEGIGTAQTLTRKIKEIFVAQKLARVKSKAWILTQYLNTVYFGDGAYGIGAAAQAFFGIPVAKLTPAQAAMLAAMIQSPSYYSPNPKAGQAYGALVFRWHYVLNAMAGLGALSQQEAQQQKFPTVIKQVNHSWAGYRGYIMQAVQYELEHTYHYTAGDINSKGLRIVTTFDQSLTSALYAAVRHNETLMRHCRPPAGLSAAPAPCTGLPKYVRAGAMLEQPGTGAILAMYSGRNYNKVQYDNALQSRNQVGSSFKPYVLATAVQQGMNVRTSILDGDSPLWIPPDTMPTTYAKTSKPSNPSWYKVTNDEAGNNNLGPVSVENATAASLNTAYTDLWHRVALDPANGQHNVVNIAKAFGVDTVASGLWKDRDQAGTALGQASLTVEEQATMIATLAAGGEYSTPHVIKQITVGNLVIPARVTHRQVLTPTQAADVDWAMSFDTGSGGTADGLGLTNGQTVIAKTGTTNLAQSAFFLGATQKYAMAVGMFVEHPGCTLPKSQQYLCQSTSALAFAPPKGLETLFGVGGLSGYGGQWPAIIWHTFFMREFNSLPPVAWPPPNNYGSKWNLMGKLPKPKPKPRRKPGPPGGCPGRGNRRKCQPSPTPPAPVSSPSPTPTKSPTPSPTPSPSPTSTRKHAAGAATLMSMAVPVPAAAVASAPSGTGQGTAAVVFTGLPAADPWLSRLRVLCE